MENGPGAGDEDGTTAPDDVGRASDGRSANEFHTLRRDGAVACEREHAVEVMH